MEIMKVRGYVYPTDEATGLRRHLELEIARLFRQARIEYFP